MSKSTPTTGTPTATIVLREMEAWTERANELAAKGDYSKTINPWESVIHAHIVERGRAIFSDGSALEKINGQRAGSGHWELPANDDYCTECGSWCDECGYCAECGMG